MSANRRLTTACGLAMALTLAGIAADGAGAEGRDEWLAGAEFQQALAQPVEILWAGNPLRDAIENLAQSQRVAIYLDRRVDPGKKVEVAIKNAPLREALQTIAERSGLGVTRLGDVVYFAPIADAGRLPPIVSAIKQRVRELPASIQRKLFRTKAVSWSDLAAPRDLLEGVARDNGLIVLNPELIPHDLWAAVDLPPLSLLDRLTLIVWQYGLTYAINATATEIRLVPIPDDLPETSDPFPEVRVPRAGRQPIDKGPSTSLERVRIGRLSIQDEQLGPVLRQLAGRLGLELRIDEPALKAAGISLDQRVTMTVEDVSIDELFEKLLQPAGLESHRRRKIVEIAPARARK